jgi:hypothetical protein
MALAHWIDAPRAGGQADGPGAMIRANPVPTAEQIQSLIARAVQNQHTNDQALEEFDRVEHVVTRKTEKAEVFTDRTERMLPSATGTMKLAIAEKGVPVSPEEYRRELESAIAALDLALHPNDRFKQDQARFQKRRHDRSELVDEASKAFRATWAGRETRGGRTLVKLLLEPDPNYRPGTRLAVIFPHVRATLWLDETQAQIARIEGDVFSDVNFAGGIVGKIYPGGHFAMEQAEAAPGVWLPTLFTYDLDGRKFVFAFGIHERTEITRYRRIGPASQAIEILRNELNNLSAASPAR